MNTVPERAAAKPWPSVLIDVLMRFALVALIAFFCFRIFHPFLNLMLWSLILAITLYPLQTRLKRRLGLLGGRQFLERAPRD